MNETTKTQTQPHPMDYESLKKGDVIPASRIEHVMQVKRTDVKAYQLAMMKMSGQIQIEFAHLGQFWTVRQQGDDLVILTDPEAHHYNVKSHESLYNRMRRALMRLQGVDRTMLDADQRDEHEHDLISQGRQVQAIRTARSQLRLESHKRTTPGLPAK